MFKKAKNSICCKLMVILIVCGMVICSFGSVAGAQDQFARFPSEERSAESMVFDLVLVRVLGMAGIVLGTGAFVLSLPFSAMGGNTEEAYERLMADPARYTFKRPLGDF